MSEHRDHQSEPIETTLRKVRGGSGDAFALLVERYQDTAYRFALHFTGNKEDAEEVARDIFVDLWDRRRRLAGRASFKHSLYDSTARVCVKWATGRQATLNALPALSLDGLPDLMPAKFGETIGLDLLERDTLSVPLQQMPAGDRLVVLLRFLGNFTLSDTATLAIIRIDEASRRTKRGLRVIADHLGLATE